MQKMQNEVDFYCEICESCGEEGCCSPLKCAYKNMVKNKPKKCKYGKTYYKDIEFAYRMFELLYEKYEDEEIFDKTYKEVYECKK